MSSLRIVFAGTPHFGIPCLDAIADSPHTLVAVYTQPDRPAGRGRHVQASAVKCWAQTHGTPVYQPLHFKETTTVDELKALEADVMVVIAYGLILPTSVLNTPRFGCINVHASLLPRWRGASPIQQAILQGDQETGVTIMQMDKGMDTGDALTSVNIPIQPNDTAESLHNSLAQIACEPLIQTLNALGKDSLKPIKQIDNLATYAPKIKKEDAVIDWTQSAQSISQQIRAFYPWPIAYTHINDQIIRIHEASVVTTPHKESPGTILSVDKTGMLVSTGLNALQIKVIQFPGGKPITIRDYLNGKHQVLCASANFS